MKMNFLGKKHNNYKNINSNNSYYNNNKKYNKRKNDNYSYNNNYSNHSNNYNKNNFNKINFKYDSIENLPIMKYKDTIKTTIAKNKVTIISGKTGCGKSTQVPKFLYDTYKEGNQKVKILMTQPRRIATISIANRIAQEYNSKLQEIVGYQIEMEKKYNNQTSILVKTTGIFLEELVHGKGKECEYDYIIMDEVHERDINIDLCLTILKSQFNQGKFKHTKLILMSATISTITFSNYFNNAPVIEINEKIHKIKYFYTDDIIKNIMEDGYYENKIPKYYTFDKSNPDVDENLFFLVKIIIEHIQRNNNQNFAGVLIFLPGLYEILSLQDFLLKNFTKDKEENNNNLNIIDNIEFFVLHSQINEEEQDKVFKPIQKRKIVIATNIAESSITIPNIDFVIDFCLMKEMEYSATSDSEKLALKWCSQANCEQRSGRTGRIREGFVFRLVSKDFFDKLNSFPIPEILRTPLEKVILKIKVFDCGEPEEILNHSLDKPDEIDIQNSIINLQNLGALTFSNEKSKSGELTEVGKIYAELPISLKYSRFLMISYAFGILETGIIVTSIISQEKKIFKIKNTTRNDLFDTKKYFGKNTDCDFISSYVAYMTWYLKFGKEYLPRFKDNENKIGIINYKTSNLIRNSKNFKEEKDFLKGKCLDGRILKDVLKTEIDLKKRLNRLGYYEFHPIDEKPKLLNINNEDEVNIFKYAICGSFYKQIFKPHYNSDEIKKYFDFSQHDAKYYEDVVLFRKVEEKELRENLKNILNKITKEKISKVTINEETSNIYVKINDEEALKKTLFVFSKNIKTKNAVNIQIENNNIIKTFTFPERPLYYYEVYYESPILSDNIYIDYDSINYILIQPNNNILNLERFVTDELRENNFKKFSRYITRLPQKKMLDYILILLFCPTISMKLNKEKNRYMGFKINNKNSLINFEYFFSKRDLIKINKLRENINDIIQTKINNLNYKENVDKFILNLNNFINKEKIKMVINDDWIDLKEKIEIEKDILSNFNNINQYNFEKLNKYMDKEKDFKNKFRIEQNNNDNDKEEIETEIKQFSFLKPIKNLIFDEDIRLCSNEGKQEIKQQNILYNNLKIDVINDLKFKEKLIGHKEGNLYCGICYSYICDVSDIEKTEFEKSHSSLILFKLRNNFNIHNLLPILSNEIVDKKNIEFKNKLVSQGITIEKFLSCKKGKHLVGYIIKSDYYLSSISDLKVTFPMEKTVKWTEFLWENNFKNYKNELNNQLKLRDKYLKERLNCILCQKLGVIYTVNEFKNHLKSSNHIEFLNSLLNENFI